MTNEKRLINAGKLASDISLKVSPMVAAGCSEKWVYSKIMECIPNAPAVNAREAVTGQWDNYSTSMMECSICKRHVPRHRYQFCPHCGGVMNLEVKAR